MCEHGRSITVRVKVPADLSHTGEARWKWAKIDACIAGVVQALQCGGIDMRASCCGHGKGDGEILLQDRRTLIIRHPEKTLLPGREPAAEGRLGDVAVMADPVEISSTLHFALYRLYLACRDARRDGRRLPGRVGEVVDTIAAIYSAEGYSEDGIPRAGTLMERFAAEDRRKAASR